MATELTTAEEATLRRCELTIRKGAHVFVEVGQALSEIKEKKLFRAEFSNFNDYCQKRWGWTRRRVDQLIDAKDVVKSIEEESKKLGAPIKSGTMVPLSERQARALKNHPPEDRARVLEEVSKSGKITASAIKEFGPPPGDPPKKRPDPPMINLDKVGRAIPDDILSTWERSGKVQELLTSISRVKGVLKEAQHENDILFVGLNFSSALAELENAYREIKTALPYAVCTSCQGKLTKTCRLCRGKGFVSKHAWDTVVPSETKRMIEKAA